MVVEHCSCVTSIVGNAVMVSAVDLFGWLYLSCSLSIPVGQLFVLLHLSCSGVDSSGTVVCFVTFVLQFVNFSGTVVCFVTFVLQWCWFQWDSCLFCYICLAVCWFLWDSCVLYCLAVCWFQWDSWLFCYICLAAVVCFVTFVLQFVNFSGAVVCFVTFVLQSVDSSGTVVCFVIFVLQLVDFSGTVVAQLSMAWFCLFWVRYKHLVPLLWGSLTLTSAEDCDHCRKKRDKVDEKIPQTHGLGVGVGCLTSSLVLIFVHHWEPVVALRHIPTHHSPFRPLKEQAIAVLWILAFMNGGPNSFSYSKWSLRKYFHPHPARRVPPCPAFLFQGFNMPVQGCLC